MTPLSVECFHFIFIPKIHIKTVNTPPQIRDRQ